MIQQFILNWMRRVEFGPVRADGSRPGSQNLRFTIYQWLGERGIVSEWWVTVQSQKSCPNVGLTSIKANHSESNQIKLKNPVARFWPGAQPRKIKANQSESQ
jgi:hypothetical protein